MKSTNQAFLIRWNTTLLSKLNQTKLYLIERIKAIRSTEWCHSLSDTGFNGNENLQ